ncbi:hypothetical protein [Pyrodictium abyssi]|uniref:DUF131 domain-containing protein n=1 Tax=Pyrodictium abyssi TaxID=54256 RepID=A0ABN6ZKV0_9CREN|nr:hypothetical protein PABY_04280 [Pyrodictium abyssi]
MLIEVVAAIGVVLGFIYAIQKGGDLRTAITYAFVGGVALPVVFMLARLAIAVLVILVKIAVLVTLLVLAYMFLRRAVSRGRRPGWR